MAQQADDEKETDWSAIFKAKPLFGDPDDFGVLVDNSAVQDADNKDNKSADDDEDSSEDECEQEACVIDDQGHVTKDDYTLRKADFKDWSINKIIKKSNLKGIIKNHDKECNETTAFWKFLKTNFKIDNYAYNHLVQLCREKVTTLQKNNPRLIKNMSFDDISAITCYTTNIVYELLNKSLRSRSADWAPFCGPLLSGLNKLPFVWGKLYRGTASNTLKSNLDKYKIGAILRWDSFSSTSTELGVAQCFAESTGTIFEIESGFRGRDIESFSALPSEKEILFSISSHFIITKIYQRGERNVVALKELPFPWDAETILWVDDIPRNNKSLMEEFEAKGIMVIPRISTYGAKQFLDFTKNAINLNTFNKFRVITDMYRKEWPEDDTSKEQVTDRYAGVTVIEALRNVGYNNKVCIFTGNKEKAINKCKERAVFNDRVLVTISADAVQKYGSFQS